MRLSQKPETIDSFSINAERAAKEHSCRLNEYRRS